jgi:hypothetical protein
MEDTRTADGVAVAFEAQYILLTAHWAGKGSGTPGFLVELADSGGPVTVHQVVHRLISREGVHIGPALSGLRDFDELRVFPVDADR